MERVGLLGGTFDPVHNGHLQLALAAKNELGLERVLLIPAVGPPHKRGGEVTGFHHRREMLLLALAGVEGLKPCFIEAELPVPSYTVDTLRLLQSREGRQLEYHFIIGMDAFADLLSWKEYRELLQRVTLVVARRKGFTDAQRLDGIAGSLGYHQSAKRWSGAPGLRDILFLQTAPVEISSSHIRHLLASGHSFVPEVHPEVMRYITRHRLYLANGG